MEQGNALLLGVGGSGRQSLARMATFCAAYDIFQIEVIKGYKFVSWRDDVRTCLMNSGIGQKPTTFLFVDTQIIDESQLEDINSILNSGDVTDLYKLEHIDQISQKYRSECVRNKLPPTEMNIL